MSIEAMKQALEALEHLHRTGDTQVFDLCYAPEVIPSLRQAIEQAEKNQFNPDWDAMAVMVDEQQRMAKRIEELEQAEKQEPVAVYQYRNPHCSDWYDGIPDHHDGHGPYEVRTLYTTPQPQREWVGLTDDERNHARQTITYSQLAMTAGEWTEAVQIETERRLKEKNT